MVEKKAREKRCSRNDNKKKKKHAALLSRQNHKNFTNKKKNEKRIQIYKTTVMLPNIEKT